MPIEPRKSRLGKDESEAKHERAWKGKGEFREEEVGECEGEAEGEAEGAEGDEGDEGDEGMLKNVTSPCHQNAETPKRQNDVKNNRRVTRATVYFVPDIHKALRLRAAESNSTVSQLVNEAVREALAADAADLDAFVLQQNERNVTFEQFICELRRRGRI